MGDLVQTHLYTSQALNTFLKVSLAMGCRQNLFISLVYLVKVKPSMQNETYEVYCYRSKCIVIDREKKLSIQTCIFTETFHQIIDYLMYEKPTACKSYLIDVSVG